MEKNTNNNKLFEKDNKFRCSYACGEKTDKQDNDSETTYEEVLFTDYDTVKWGYAIEITVEEFFDMFEKMINDRKICDTKIELDDGMLTFRVKETNKLYKILLDEREVNNIKSGIPSRNIRILLTLFDHEKELRFQDEREKEMDRHNEKLLDEARSGNIVNDQAKTLYIKELEEKLKENKMAKVKEIINNLSAEWHHENPARVINVMLGVALTLSAFITSFIIKDFSYFYYQLILPTIINLNVARIVLKKSLPVIKELNKENELITHKINSLKSMSVPQEMIEVKYEEKKDNNRLDINSKAKNITRLIEKLSEDKREEYANKLLAILDQYQLEFKSLKREGLVLYTEDTLKTKYLIKLMEFEEVINSEIDNSNKMREYNNTVKQIKELANPKKKIRTIE